MHDQYIINIFYKKNKLEVWIPFSMKTFCWRLEKFSNFNTHISISSPSFHTYKYWARIRMKYDAHCEAWNCLGWAPTGAVLIHQVNETFHNRWTRTHDVTSIIEQFATKNQLHVSHYETKHPHYILQTLEMVLLLNKRQYTFLNSGPRSPERPGKRSRGVCCWDHPALPETWSKIVPIDKRINAKFKNRVSWFQVQLRWIGLVHPIK